MATKTPEEIKKLLDAPLPDEAITPHPTKTYLSNIKAIYVIDRLNEVFGIGGWQVKNEIVEKVTLEKISKAGTPSTNTMVVVKSVFYANGDIYIESYGGNDNEDLGDAYKGACTDALTKIGSYLGIGADVWRGKQKAGKLPVKEDPLLKGINNNDDPFLN